LKISGGKGIIREAKYGKRTESRREKAGFSGTGEGLDVRCEREV
jgi:hypothetical protein